jgi:uncharacterized protein (DUF885 family)
MKLRRLRQLGTVAVVVVGLGFGEPGPERAWSAQGLPGSDLQPGDVRDGATAHREGDAVLRSMIENFSADRSSLEKKYEFTLAPNYPRRMAEFYRAWAADLQRLPFAQLSQDAKIDYLLLRNRVAFLANRLELETQQDVAIHGALPGLPIAVQMWEARLAGQRPQGPESARQYEQLRGEVAAAQKRLEQPAPELQVILSDATLALWATQRLQHQIQMLENLHRYYDGYDPDYSWWARKPWEELQKEIRSYAQAFRRAALGRSSDDPDAIVGLPIGEAALMAELTNAMIAYSPAELVQIAEQEMAWCDEQMAIVAAEMGFPDWRAAQEAVKNRFVPPGDQPQLIIEMADEAIEFITQRDLVTVPDLAREVWRTQMMSPERQRVSPFFLGGDTIIISYPTDSMTHEEKLMSLRGNNPHFSRAVVHHELIPGHHLQQFMLKRHKPYRSEFATPFWMEGWALYWEMLLWDLGFAQTPQDKLGMLFWRKHRCARIIFSLNYHLKRMSPEACIDYLVERVGHERNNATAEVRRSFAGSYGPLYQAAYMLGGLQIRNLHQELVASGRWTPRKFHDTILQQHSIPIEMLRAKLLDLPLAPDWQPGWRFYPSLP